MALKVNKVSYDSPYEGRLSNNDLLLEIGGEPIADNAYFSTQLAKARESSVSVQIKCLSFIKGEFFEIEYNGERLGIDTVEVSREESQAIQLRVNHSELVEHAKSRSEYILVSTTPFIAGHEILEVLDIVTAERVSGINIVADVMMSFRDIFGGNSGVAQSSLKKMRQECMQLLRYEAALIGADGVVGVDFDYSEFSGKGSAMLFLVASGTAVKLKKS